jgi:hypothetical protein
MMVDVAPKHVVKVQQMCVKNKHSAFILIYSQLDVTLHSLFYLETALRVSGGASTRLQKRKHVPPETCRAVSK